MTTYHVQAIDALLQRYPCRETIIHTRTSDELVRIRQHRSQLLDRSHVTCAVGEVCRTHFEDMCRQVLGYIRFLKCWGCR